MGRNFLSLLVQTAKEWRKSQTARLAGTLAFHAVSSLLAMLLLIASVASNAFQRNTIRAEITDGLEQIVGSNTAQVLNNAMRNAAEDIQQSSILTIISIFLALLYTASRVFLRLQEALNIIWRVENHQSKGVKKSITHIVTSIAASLAFGSLILFILMLNGSAFTLVSLLHRLLPFETLAGLYQLAGFTLIIMVMAVIFALIFRFMSKKQLAWPSVLLGALLTSVLFSIGQFILSWYINLTNPGTIYGIAGTFVILLLWVYIGARIVLFGAIFTYLHAKQQTQPEASGSVSSSPRVQQMVGMSD